MKVEELEKLRREIDRLDKSLIEVLTQRMHVAKQIADLKKRLGLKVKDEAREKDVIRRIRNFAREKGLDPDFADNLMRMVMGQAISEETMRIGGLKFWRQIEETFKDYPKELEVLKVLFKHGLRVGNKGEVLCGEMRIPYLQISRVAKTDRRTVVAAIKKILKNEWLKSFFSNLSPIPYLRDVGREAGWGVVEITPYDASKPGVLKAIIDVISSHGISIRQAVADDPHLIPQPKLTLITDRPLPESVLAELRKLPEIYSVVVY